MTTLILYDDEVARSFEPFATTRPLGEMRAGALLIRERWEHVLGATTEGFISSPHLRRFAELDAPPFAGQSFATAFVGFQSGPVTTNGASRAGTDREGSGSGLTRVCLVNTRALPTLVQTATEVVHGPAEIVRYRVGEAVAALELPVNLLETLAMQSALAARVETDAPGSTTGGAISLDDLAREFDDAGHGAHDVELDGLWLGEVWDIIRHLASMLNDDLPIVAARHECDAPVHAAVTGTHPVYLDRSANIEPHVVFDTTLGPVLVRQGAVVQAFTRVVGPCYIGAGSTVTTDRISGSSIGDVCRVHGELSSSVFIGHANKGHDGFVGHSLVGRWVNMGAGTITSNLKNTYGTVALWTPAGVRDTGLQFLGTLFGDHAKTGIGMRLTTGCVLGAATNVMDRMPPKYVSPFAWGTGAPYDRYQLSKFLETAARMMARRSITLDEAQEEFWRNVFAHATGQEQREHDPRHGTGERQ